MTTDNQGLPQDQRGGEAADGMKSALLEVQKMMNVLKFQSDAGIGGFCAGPAFIRVMRQVEDTLARPAPEALGAAKGELSDSELVDALETAYEAMNYLGDVLNGMDAVTEEDEKNTYPAFEKVRAILAKANGELDAAFSDATNAAVALERQQSATPADAASEADKRAIPMTGDEIRAICRDAKAHCAPSDEVQGSDYVLATLRYLNQRERQQGAQSNG